MQNLNLNTSQVELVIEHPQAHSIAEVTGLQARLDTIQSLADTPSGLSLGLVGNTTLSKARVAVYERTGAQGFLASTYFYGMALYENVPASSVGLGFYGSTASSLPDQDGQGGSAPGMLLRTTGDVGIGTVLPTAKLHVVGDILASGSITGSSKSFRIPHPETSKRDAGYQLRHWCVETDTPAGLVMYRRTIEMTSSRTTIEMPSWFSSLVKDVTVHVTPYRHFGSGWGDCIGNTIEVYTTTLGQWHIQILACRADEHAMCCDQLVEFIPVQPPQNESGSPFPTHQV